MTPNVIIEELLDPDGKKMVEYGLQRGELSGTQVQEVASLRAKHRRVSASDLFALVLARALKATVLTGDRHLTQVAAQEGVPVHGTLWVLDELVRLAVVAPSQAAQALKQMLANRRRLPQAKCKKRLSLNNSQKKQFP